MDSFDLIQWVFLFAELVSLLIFIVYIFKMSNSITKRRNDIYTVISFASIIVSLTIKLALRSQGIILMESS